jgi:hypothetical protein
MAKLKFELPAPLDSAKAYDKIKALLNGENDFKKLDPKVQCTFDDPNKTCRVVGSQFKANMTVQQTGSNSSEIQIELDLPLALSLFKGKIKETLEKNLKRIL